MSKRITNLQTRYDDEDNLIISAKVDGIEFTNIVGDGATQAAPLRLTNNIFNTGNTENVNLAVNAVDIDWNGAVLKIA